MEELSIIDQHFKSGNSLVDYLKAQQELSLSNEAENNFRKALLLSSASYFEKEITETMIDFARTRSNNDDMIISIIKIKSINRQYHTYFDWDDLSSGYGKFLGLFGDDFKKSFKIKIKGENKLEEAVKAFLQIGQERNKVVHQNYAEIVIDKTAEEIYNLYKTALYFVETIKKELIKHD